MKILLVEDDDRIAKPLAEELHHQGYVVDLAEDGIEGWEWAQMVEYDLILLDIMLPRLDGIRLCKRLRNVKYKGFILMLTARDTLNDKIIGLDAGADDYLIKPFELEELAARIRALLRRPPEMRSQALSYGQIELDSHLHIATYNGRDLTLTPKEFLLLQCFLEYPKQVFTRRKLLERLWEIDSLSGEGTIKTHINNLRQKIVSVGGDRKIIETVYGVGYRLGKE
ncbi:MAG: response regulator transcription factor [Cyanobacteria bacterium SBLK]|nr:response regulator transcription factor [Cyanobacteria bacterium SBLK]